MAYEGMRGLKQLFGHARTHHEIAHQDEQRNHRKAVGQASLVADGAHHLGGDIEVEFPGGSNETHKAHRKGHGNAKECEDDKGPQGQECFGHAAFTKRSEAHPVLAGAA